ncbi:hypothetical protein [Crossiella sp. NPDC003009]
MSGPDNNAEDVAARCRAGGGLIRVSLGDLRKDLGHQKLGSLVLGKIAANLEAAGIGHFPLGVLDKNCNTKPRQEQTVWVYDRDGDLRARVLDAVLDPEEHDVRAVLDGLLVNATTGLSPEQKLDRIRDLVGG